MPRAQRRRPAIQLVYRALRGTGDVSSVVQHRRGIELGSELLVADAAHTRADVFITIGILVGILLTRQGWWWPIHGRFSWPWPLSSWRIASSAHRAVLVTALSPPRHPERRPGRARREERLRHRSRGPPTALRRGDGVRGPHGRGVPRTPSRSGGGATQTRPAAVRSHRSRGTMLSLSGEQRSRTAAGGRRRLLKQEYQEFLLQRIEEYKNGSRERICWRSATRRCASSRRARRTVPLTRCCCSSTSTASSPAVAPAFLPSLARKHRACARSAPDPLGLESDGPLVSAVRRLEPGDLAVESAPRRSRRPSSSRRTTPRCFSWITTSGRSKARRAGRSLSSSPAGSRRSSSRSAAGSRRGAQPGDHRSAALAPARARDRHALARRAAAAHPPGGVHVILPSPAVREVIRSPRRRAESVWRLEVVRRAVQGERRVHGDQAGASAGHGAERVE